MLKNKMEYCKVCPSNCRPKNYVRIRMYMHIHIHPYRELVARLRVEGKKLKLAQPSGEHNRIV